VASRSRQGLGGDGEATGEGGATRLKRKNRAEEEDGQGQEVICHSLWGQIQRGRMCWRAKCAKMVNLYAFSLSVGKNVVIFGMMLCEEVSSAIIVKS
jgi:hypothetical protein